MNKSVAIGFGVAALTAWYFPGFNGIFSDPAQITVGESRIIAAVFTVGGIILWFLPQTERLCGAMEGELRQLREDNKAVRQQLADIKMIYFEAAWHETQQIRASEANRHSEV